MNREQALAVLCDLAFTIGGEVSLGTLLTRTLQRFLYHTGFPVGFVLSGESRNEDRREADVQLEVAIGDYRLARRQGERLSLPLALLPDRAALLDDPLLFASLGTHRPMRVALSLPIEGYGHMLLLSPRIPETSLPLTELFAPVLSRLATAITLCQGYERDVQHRIERQAYFNPLTGLPNANRFAGVLKDAILRAGRAGRMLAVVYLDIDDFARLNRQYGQETVDRLLTAYATRLQAQVHPGEFVAHLMGDEFVLLLPDLPDRQQVEERIVALQEAEREVLSVVGCSVRLHATAGVAVFPGDAEEADLLLRHAQMAMHQAKQDARGGYRMFDVEQDRMAHERRDLLERFGRALADGELVLYYQPKVDMTSSRVVGVEALLRWRDPVRGLRLPGEFLPVVESSDLICVLGRWVLAEAVRQSVAWRRLGLELPISVNIAGRHFQQPDFIRQIRAVFSALPEALPADLEIEILESSAIGDFGQAQQIIHACEEIGIRVALDDFGTGYSSLAYLSQLPTNTIKIDQMFVREMFEQRVEPAIIRAIVQIADIFGHQVIAEGVETVEHGMLLISMGCRYAQGFGIARPMPAEDLPAWVNTYRVPQEWPRVHGMAWSRDLFELLRCRHHHHVLPSFTACRNCFPLCQAGKEAPSCAITPWLECQGVDDARLDGLRDRYLAYQAALQGAEEDSARSERLRAEFIAALDELIESVGRRA
ncbi:MAG: EAL domain-containing protein [Zoogloea sp.]|nr:EAL domain-containing protein [Zoogloea sp.]